MFNVCGIIRISVFFWSFFLENCVFYLSFQVLDRFIQSFLSNTGNCTWYFVLTYKGRESEKGFIFACMCTYMCMYICICVLSDFSHVWLFATPWTIAARLLCPWDSPGKDTGVGCRALLQGIFPTQGLNPHLLHPLHCRQILYRWATGEARI